MSTNNTLSNKIIDILDDNYELVTQYQQIPGMVSIFDSIPEIVSTLQSNTKLFQNFRLPTLLKESLEYSVREGRGIVDSMKFLANRDFNCDNTIQMYFKEVGKIYKENGDNFDIEYCQDNKDLLIKMNLKTVISVAKQYQGTGVELADLISAGNLGLCKAWEKFDPSKQDLQSQIREEFETEEVYSGAEVIKKVTQYITYGKALEKVHKRFKPNKLYNCEVIKHWIESNIRPAKFSSVAVMWIRAYILSEIDQNSRVVKKPKTDIYKDKLKFGSYIRENILDIDRQISVDSDTTYGEVMGMEDDTISNVEVNDAYDFYKSHLKRLLEDLNPRDRNILLKRFGIGLPRPMSPKEIGIQEGISISRVCQLFQNALQKVKENAQKYDVPVEELFAACERFK